MRLKSLIEILLCEALKWCSLLKNVEFVCTFTFIAAKMVFQVSIIEIMKEKMDKNRSP